jgi:hypothetical protein
MRVGARWGDVRILNVSSRGLLLQSCDAPPRGSYLEVRRGMHTIVARVVWTGDQRFGVQTQDPLCVDAIIREPDKSAPEFREPGEEGTALDRRAPQRRASAEQRLERSRVIGRTAEFACVALFGAAAALIGYAALEAAFATPVARVSEALAPADGESL